MSGSKLIKEEKEGNVMSELSPVERVLARCTWCFLFGFYSNDLVGAASWFCLVSLEAAVEDRSKAHSLRDVVASEVSLEKAHLDDLILDGWHH